MVTFWWGLVGFWATTSLHAQPSDPWRQLQRPRGIGFGNRPISFGAGGGVGFTPRPPIPFGTGNRPNIAGGLGFSNQVNRPNRPGNLFGSWPSFGGLWGKPTTTSPGRPESQNSSTYFQTSSITSYSNGSTSDRDGSNQITEINSRPYKPGSSFTTTQSGFNKTIHSVTSSSSDTITSSSNPGLSEVTNSTITTTHSKPETSSFINNIFLSSLTGGSVGNSSENLGLDTTVTTVNTGLPPVSVEKGPSQSSVDTITGSAVDSAFEIPSSFIGENSSLTGEVENGTSGYGSPGHEMAVPSPEITVDAFNVHGTSESSGESPPNTISVSQSSGESGGNNLPENPSTEGSGSIIDVSNNGITGPSQTVKPTLTYQSTTVPTNSTITEVSGESDILSNVESGLIGVVNNFGGGGITAGTSATASTSSDMVSGSSSNSGLESATVSVNNLGTGGMPSATSEFTSTDNINELDIIIPPSAGYVSSVAPATGSSVQHELAGPLASMGSISESVGTDLGNIEPSESSGSAGSFESVGSLEGSIPTFTPISESTGSSTTLEEVSSSSTAGSDSHSAGGVANFGSSQSSVGTSSNEETDAGTTDDLETIVSVITSSTGGMGSLSSSGSNTLTNGGSETVGPVNTSSTPDVGSLSTENPFAFVSSSSESNTAQSGVSESLGTVSTSSVAGDLTALGIAEFGNVSTSESEAGLTAGLETEDTSSILSTVSYPTQCNGGFCSVGTLSSSGSGTETTVGSESVESTNTSSFAGLNTTDAAIHVTDESTAGITSSSDSVTMSTVSPTIFGALGTLPSAGQLSNPTENVTGFGTTGSSTVTASNAELEVETDTSVGSVGASSTAGSHSTGAVANVVTDALSPGTSTSLESNIMSTDGSGILGALGPLSNAGSLSNPTGSVTGFGTTGSYAMTASNAESDVGTDAGLGSVGASFSAGSESHSTGGVANVITDALSAGTSPSSESVTLSTDGSGIHGALESSSNAGSLSNPTENVTGFGTTGSSAGTASNVESDLVTDVGSGIVGLVGTSSTAGSGSHPTGGVVNFGGAGASNDIVSNVLITGSNVTSSLVQAGTGSSLHSGDSLVYLGIGSFDSCKVERFDAGFFGFSIPLHLCGGVGFFGPLMIDSY